MPLMHPHRYRTPSLDGSTAADRITRAFCLLWLVVALHSPLWAADDGVFILPDGTPWIEIAEADLLAGLPPAAGPVITTTPAGRGALFDLTGTEDTYQPTPEFFHRGSDSFHFEAELKDTGVWSTAFLVAGMKGDGRFFLPLDHLGELSSVVQTNDEDIHSNTSDPIHGAYDLLFDLEPGSVAYITYSSDDGGLGDGPKGGTLGGGIDAGDGAHHGSAHLTIALAEDDLGQLLARVVLLEGDSGPELAGDVMVGGQFVRIGQAAVDPGSAWELQWWGATAGGSQDGGGVLLIDGVAVAKLGGLDNPELERPVSWSFGALTNTGVTGTLQLDDLRGGAALTVPRIQPLFADNFQAAVPVWSGYDCGLSSAPAPGGGALTVALAGSTIDCFLSRALDGPQRQIKTRFMFDMAGAGIGAGEEISLFRGHRPTGGTDPIDVRVRRDVDGSLEVTVASFEGGDQPVILDGYPIPESGEVEIEVHWWAATSPFIADGGLRLLVDGYPQAQDLSLNNQGAEVSELTLGAMDVGSGSFGHVTFGTFEVWR